MPKFEVGERVYHTKLGLGIVVDNTMFVVDNTIFHGNISSDSIAIEFDKSVQQFVPDHREPPYDRVYGFNADGSHFAWDITSIRGTLSLVNDLIPIPDDWYQQLVE